MRRSARRQTARATCSAAPAGLPPARMNRRSGGNSASYRSITCSSRVTSSSPKRGLGDAGGQFFAGIGELRAEREQVLLETHELGIDFGVGARRAGQAQEGVRLVDLAVRVNARLTLPDARAVEERSVAGIARARVDFHGPA